MVSSWGSRALTAHSSNPYERFCLALEGLIEHRQCENIEQNRTGTDPPTHDDHVGHDAKLNDFIRAAHDPSPAYSCAGSMEQFNLAS